MLLSQKLCRAIVSIVIACFFVTSMPMSHGQAALISSDNIAAQSAVTNDRARLDDLVMREDIQRDLLAYGISPQEARARVAGLTDEEVIQVAGRLDQLPAGQGAFGVLVGAALFVFVVLLITDIAGLTKVFPFTKAQR